MILEVRVRVRVRVRMYAPGENDLVGLLFICFKNFSFSLTQSS